MCMLWKILKHCIIKDKKPTKVWIGVTDHCNSRCIMCHQWAQKGTPKEEMLTPEEYYRIFSDPYLSDIDTIIISGGEPTLRDDLYEIIVALHNALPNAEIGLSTNGLLPATFDDLIFRLLNVNGLKFNIGVSLESCDEKIDNAIRAPNHHSIATTSLLISKFKRFVDDSIHIKNISIGTMILPENIHTIKKTMEQFERVGISCILQMPEESKYYNDAQLAKERPYNVREFVASLPDRFNMLREHWLKYLDGKDYSFKCYALRDFFGLKCNGDVIPCLKKWDLVVGNLRTDKPEDILTTPGYRNIAVFYCQGCLNTWGCYWSWQADGWPYVKYYLRHPVKFIRKMIA